MSAIAEPEALNPVSGYKFLYLIAIKYKMKNLGHMPRAINAYGISLEVFCISIQNT